MFFCCSFESRDKQMLQHFKTFIFSKRQLSTYLHAQPLKPHTSDKLMSIMYQVPFRRSLSYSLFLQQKLSCQISYRYCPCTVVVTNETSPASCIHLFTTVSTSCTKDIYIYIYKKTAKSQTKGVSFQYPLGASNRRSQNTLVKVKAQCMLWHRLQSLWQSRWN